MPKQGETPPTLQQLREGLKGVGNTWLPKVLVLTNMIPKGPTGKPKRIGLAKMWGVPALAQNDTDTYTIHGQGGEKFERLTYAANPEDIFFGQEAPVFKLPLHVQLHVNGDLELKEQSVHDVWIREEGGGMSWECIVTQWDGEAADEKKTPFALSEDEIHEIFKHVAEYFPAMSGARPSCFGDG